MRTQRTSDGLTVQAVAGSHVMLLGWDFPKSKCKRLAGFGVNRTFHEEEEAFWLRGMKTFEATEGQIVSHDFYGRNFSTASALS